MRSLSFFPALLEARPRAKGRRLLFPLVSHDGSLRLPAPARRRAGFPNGTPRTEGTYTLDFFFFFSFFFVIVVVGPRAADRFVESQRACFNICTRCAREWYATAAAAASTACSPAGMESSLKLPTSFGSYRESVALYVNARGRRGRPSTSRCPEKGGSDNSDARVICMWFPLCGVGLIRDLIAEII